jgi:S-DNA-T family DNA segregation ATPase FtsK/SpoIIIE
MILPFALCKTVFVKINITYIAKIPHLLIAGSIDSEISVYVNSLIMSIFYTKTPSEVKFIMVKPKVIELSCSKDIPQFYHPVITNYKSKRGLNALGQIVFEMESRFKN